MNFTLAGIVMFALDRPVIGVGEVFRRRAGVWRTAPRTLFSPNVVGADGGGGMAPGEQRWDVDP